jgi:DNA-binding Lrp family transcriptional regulator
MDAYMLIHTEPGALVDKVSGPYDLVVRVVGESLAEIAESVVTPIQLVPGVLRTLTCPLLHIRTLVQAAA